MDLKVLGITQDELQDRVVRAIAERVLGTRYSDEEDNYADRLLPILEKKITATIDAAVSRLAEQHVLPNVTEYIENLTLQETNRWGEKAGEPVTFIQYLTQRAEAYMQEKVNFDGKNQAEGGYGWSGHQTRITYLVNSHLKYSIERAMKDALQIANSAIASGIEGTVKMQLEKIVAGMRAKVELPR